MMLKLSASIAASLALITVSAYVILALAAPCLIAGPFVIGVKAFFGVPC